MTKKLAVAALAMNCLAAHAAGIQTDYVVTYLEDGHERVELGWWIQDTSGRTRLDIDEWTEIVDPVEHLTWRANSKRGRYNQARIAQPISSPLINSPGSLNGPGSREISRIDLGTREISGVKCGATLVEVFVSGGGFTTQIEFEACATEAFGFPFNVQFATRLQGSERTTELRNIFALTDAELEGRFRPAEDWKESRFEIARTTVAWTGLWPFTRPASKVTGTVLPLAATPTPPRTRLVAAAPRQRGAPRRLWRRRDCPLAVFTAARPTWPAAMAPVPCSTAERIGIDPAAARRIAQRS
ncbi:MAG: hypothetical protein OXF98_01335 [Rhodospirillaceae bacterium]|nr:hypothetical protein [Rhodospirillaceae bacterium]